MLRTLALAAAVVALPLATGACSSMGMGSNTTSASTVSRDSQGAGAVPGAVTREGDTASTGTPGPKNPPN